MANKKITQLTELTSADSGDFLPIADISATETKKISFANLIGAFPTSATDNAIVRFDGTTGKLLQNSSVTISDLTTVVELNLPSKAGAGTHFQFTAGASSDNIGGNSYIVGGTGGTNQVGGNADILGGAGNGSAAGGVAYAIGGQGGSTGNGGKAIVQGGAGGATSGNGGEVNINGGNGTNGDAIGGAIKLYPGAKTGSGTRGYTYLFQDTASSYYAQLNIDELTAGRAYTFPNVGGNIAVATSGAGVPTGAAPVAIGQIYVDTSASKVYISKGTSAGSDWLILN